MDQKSEIWQEQREIIMNSACETFARFGFRKTTMEDIAEGAGLRKPSLYYYFKSKEEIFSAVVRKESQELLDIMEKAAAEESSLRGKLKAFFFARFKFFKEKRNLYSVSQKNLIEMRPLIQEARDEFIEEEMDALTGILEHGIASDEIEIDNPKLFSLVAIASLQGIDSTFWRRGFEEQIEAGLELMMNIFYRGVRKELKK